LFKSINKYS